MASMRVVGNMHKKKENTEGREIQYRDRRRGDSPYS